MTHHAHEFVHRGGIECAICGEIIRDAEEHECGVTPTGHTPRIWQHPQEVEQ